jgi:hypothetical protein
MAAGRVLVLVQVMSIPASVGAATCVIPLLRGNVVAAVRFLVSGLRFSMLRGTFGFDHFPSSL